jgi:hypothetical protein
VGEKTVKVRFWRAPTGAGESGRMPGEIGRMLAQSGRMLGQSISFRKNTSYPNTDGCGRKVMPGIRVTIERFTDESQPGWVECSLVDAAGATHLFEEKVPIVTKHDLDARSAYPCDGMIACTVISTHRDDEDREIVTVDTERPWGIESRSGQVRFEVLREQIVEPEGAPGWGHKG